MLGHLRGYSPLILSLCLLATGLAQLGQTLTPAVISREESQLSTPQLPLANRPAQPADPIASPYPLPWGWVESNQAEVTRNGRPAVRTFESDKVLSPDGEYVAYSQIQMQTQPQFADTQIQSTLLIQHRSTGQTEKISLPMSITRDPQNPRDLSGTIGILWPVGWSQSGDRLLVRNFEALMGSDVASDSAVIWHRQSKRIATVLPQNTDFDTAVLLGWSSTHPNQLLFRTSILGDKQENLLSVDERGLTIASPGDRPLIFGKRLPDH